ncbi:MULTISPECIES: LysE/ArgO family amino acid transporter [Gulbenkiania]|uniref:Arginine exporter protein ArgO n=1 Tax=Gulbenkiania indica TaxID=375574 RepID=A0A0K6GVN2_9NEIS|nr:MULTISPECIES: LysE/ArgO family amino acid transporter [Gulbenkiania]CUA82801.1 Arginine exporter protein ArgO [Gulbenkiania indica]
MNWSIYLSALGLTASQIVGIGPQNAYVLRQGIGRSHVLPIVTICIACDILLIGSGVLGLGRLIATQPMLIQVVTWGGAGFIIWLGIKALRNALRPGALTVQGGVERDRKTAIRTILMVTLLNPYVWLDTVVLIGSLSTVYGESGRVPFLLGSLTASFCWFAGIGFFAGKLAPYFEKPASWRVLDGFIAAVMFFTAGMLVVNFGLR